MAYENGYRGNGPIVTGYRVLLTALTAALTLIAGLALSSLNDLAATQSNMRGDIRELRGDIAALRETLAGEYITREETRVLIEGVEQRLHRRMDSDVFHGYPAQDPDPRHGR